MKTRSTRILFLLALLSTQVFAGGKLTWTWHEPGMELYSPGFSPDGREITLVRKRHIPDGDEAENLSPAELAKLMAPIEKDKRYADPEVIFLTIGDNAATRVDWGWDPAFSPDGREIAYAFQKKPISRFRVLAETMAGNDIRIFRRDNKAIRTIATPATGYLADPIFNPDGKQVVYSLANAINGAWGGNIGISRVATDGSNGKVLYAVTKDFELYHFIPRKEDWPANHSNDTNEESGIRVIRVIV